MAKTPPTLSVVINTKNSADTLTRALKSVAKLADEIIVMDMRSTDKTREIAEKFEAKVFSHPDVGYVEPARNAALKKATGDWILVLDADEEISPSLSEEIRRQIETSTADAFFLPRRNIIFGRVVHTGWWPDYILRLFRRGHVTWSDELHAVPQVTGTIDRLPAEEELSITHHNYQTVDQFIDRAQRYAGIEAKRVTRENGAPDPARAFFAELMQRYYGWEGREDGTHGFMLSFLQGVQKVIEQAKVWEQKGFTENRVRPNLVAVLEQALRDARYWEADRRVKRSVGLALWYWKVRRRFRL